jgi:hypothetical protein
VYNVSLPDEINRNISQLVGLTSPLPDDVARVDPRYLKAAETPVLSLFGRFELSANQTEQIRDTLPSLPPTVQAVCVCLNSSALFSDSLRWIVAERKAAHPASGERLQLLERFGSSVAFFVTEASSPRAFIVSSVD